ncbi:hypothetical protein AMS68_007532 [Peltaster fructicola]|uniref:Uncharacterized protein n=1 Tax=Peltaster fructicola TaxID=286661 RepID=A0A6H0Y532_9PEZI|nr:hypothetical protein AMS68_007532 [Peltaster fructicola]
MPSTWAISAIALATLLRAVSAQGMTMVPAAFDATAYNQMVDCIKETGVNYDVAIDDGRTVIIPAEGQQINLDDTDKALGTCLDTYAPVLMMAVDDGRDNTAEKPSQSLDLATADWALSNGAQGMTSQNGSLGAIEERAPLSGSLLATRAAPRAYFYAYGSFEKKCHSPGHVATYTGQCKSQASAYTSIAFGNADPTHTLRVSLWPHHDCGRGYAKGKDGRRNISVAPNHDSTCQEKTTYSWYGVYCC